MAWQLYQGDALETLKQMEDESINCCVTSPPYWGLRDYGVDVQLGLEPTPEEYVANMVEVFREVKRVLRNDGTLWLNLGDSYVGSWGNYGGQKRGMGSQRKIISGSRIHQEAYDGLEKWRPPTSNKINNLKPKDLAGIPWRVALALQADGWWLRSDIIWAKPNPMPESVTDRPTKAHEYIFLLSKSDRYFYDNEAIKEPASNEGKLVSLGDKSFSRGQAKGKGIKPSGNGNADEYLVPAGRNKRTVWNITTKPYKEAHFATFPPELPEICIKAGCPQGGTVLDPFAGAGTTLYVAEQLGRNSIGIELNPDYCDIIRRRMAGIEVI